jgi:HSP20 family protein
MTCGRKEGERIMAFNDLSVRNPLFQFRNEMDHLLGGFFGLPREDVFPPPLRNQPAVTVWEQDDALMVEMEVPGVKKDQIDLSVVGKELTVRINRPEGSPDGVVYHRRERPVGSFNRVFSLPTEVDANRVGAELRDGVLTVTLPKAESAKPRKITVAG